VARRWRGWFWTAVATAFLTVVAGAVIAFIGYRQTSGPDGAVKGYFAALERSDAASALAFGDIPDGARTLLTSRVLREQQHLAPISNVQITDVQHSGKTATVSVHFVLDFSGERLGVDDSVQVIHRGGSWRLARVAATTRLDVLQAIDRASVVGAPVPPDAVLVFPGAAPIRLDTPYLAVEPETSIVTLSGSNDTAIGITVSTAGRTAIRSVLQTQLQSCLTTGAKADPRCPLPTPRAVPGTVRATLPPNAADAVGMVVQADSSGLVQLTGKLPLNGTYTALDFNNIAHGYRGAFTLPVQALAYPGSPVVVSWQRGSTS
jgi:hypothetical protein